MNQCDRTRMPTERVNHAWNKTTECMINYATHACELRAKRLINSHSNTSPIGSHGHFMS
ncbi:hypothetical protein ACFCW7_15665 [Paenibacillus glucanolyticus]|uniref:hypothetical protein n=1 Tax=Paenibacillus glucanolyticus TaxID=59843 RepID=UPI0035DD7392